MAKSEINSCAMARGDIQMSFQPALMSVAKGWWLVTLAAFALSYGETRAMAQADKPIASVNNEPISEGEFFHRLQLVKGSDFLVPTTPPSMRSESAGYIVLNSIINERLILQLAAKNNLTPTDAEIDVDLVPLM